jgi:hypothetical protein
MVGKVRAAGGRDYYGRVIQRAGELLETISKLAYTVTPAKAGVQNPGKNLDSGFRRNDDQRRLSHFEIVS